MLDIERNNFLHRYFRKIKEEFHKRMFYTFIFGMFEFIIVAFSIMIYLMQDTMLLEMIFFISFSVVMVYVFYNYIIYINCYKNLKRSNDSLDDYFGIIHEKGVSIKKIDELRDEEKRKFEKYKLFINIYLNSNPVKIADYREVMKDEMFDLIGTIIRFCHCCKSYITFDSFSRANRDIDINRLETLWNDKRLRFYCCFCMDNIEERSRQYNVRYYQS